jgi:hypothetical protein
MTRKGCLRWIIVFAVIIAAGILSDTWRANRPRPVQLKEVFEESGLKVPDYASDLKGEKGFVDLHGDFSAELSFSVRPEDLGYFMNLPTKAWGKPEDFQPLEAKGRCGSFDVPPGSYMIKESSPNGEYSRCYAVDPAARRVYFHRGSV